MAHFAKITEDNIVLHVIVVDDKDIKNEQGVEVETIGQIYLEKNNNWPANLWIKTSYNTIRNQHKTGGTPFRGNFAGIGYSWDSENQIFWGPKPYPSWSKDIPTASWISPVGPEPYLSEEEKGTHYYNWNEENQIWNKIAK